MKSIQILFKSKGVLVEKWILEGGSKVSSKVIEKTKGFSKVTTNCETHDDILNTNINDDGIFCKTCGVKLKLIPAWIFPV